MSRLYVGTVVSNSSVGQEPGQELLAAQMGRVWSSVIVYGLAPIALSELTGGLCPPLPGRQQF